MSDDEFSILWKQKNPSNISPTNKPIEKFDLINDSFELDGKHICKYCYKEFKLQKSILNHLKRCKS